MVYYLKCCGSISSFFYIVGNVAENDDMKLVRVVEVHSKEVQDSPL